MIREHLLKYIPKPRRLGTSPRPSNKATIKLKQQTAIFEVDRCYLSFAIDISVLVGGHWWDGSKNSKNGLGTQLASPINLNSKKLDRLVQALHPSYLRIGGSEADSIQYFCSNSIPTHSNNNTVQLSEQIWNDLHAFIQRNQLKLMFTFKYGLTQRRAHGSWPTDDALLLLQHCQKHNQHIDVCELGNELNAYWAFHGLRSQPTAKHLAKDYDRFARLVRTHMPNARICGPGSAFWPRLGETIKPFSNITEKFLSLLEVKLDIVDWHYYPFQSTRSPVRTRNATPKSILTPKSLSSYGKYASQLQNWRDSSQPSAELWTGETGSAQCGGQAKISDRFVSCFWWADQLGRGARHKQKVMIRQSLIGGDYGLIQNRSLKPRPDYWVSWLWVKLMGPEVLDVTSNIDSLKVYCHSKKNNLKKTLLIINMSENECSLHYKKFGILTKRYCITAKKLTSKNIRINGIKPKFKQGKVQLSSFPQLDQRSTVPGYSISFLCFSQY